MKLRTPTGPNAVEGFAVMHMIRNGQCLLPDLGSDVRSALYGPPVLSRRLRRRLGRGKLRNREADATQPFSLNGDERPLAPLSPDTG
jgi:hypothetical protein